MSKIKTIILVVVILAVGFFAYSFFFVSNTDTSAKLTDVSNVGDSTNASSTSEVNQNDLYVKQLIALRAISFNFDLFNDDAYKILHAANTDIPPEEKGRHNPFAPIEFGDGQYVGENPLVNSTTTVSSTGFQMTSSSTIKFQPPSTTTAPRVVPKK